MNIKITYNWLREYLNTDADPYELQKYLSLDGPSIETVDKVGEDYVFDIEITSNRVDAASVFGVAQEAQAILPQFGKRAILIDNPVEKYLFKNIEQSSTSLQLNIEQFDQKLCTRFTALILSNIHIGPSPELIKNRLQWCGIQSINNVVDISNYLMLSFGQPTHMFDYDKIGGHLMHMRESQKGEKLITLDGRDIKLPGGDIVIEDKHGLIDLCGIMGGLNSAITSETKNIVFFVQTYNKRKIRKTSMTTGQRTVAATYFEKGLDEERVEPTLVFGVELLKQYAGAQVASQLYDIYPKRFTPTIIKVTQKDIDRLIGVELEPTRIEDILRRLGFGVENKNKKFIVSVPSFRKDDIAIKEDIVEEVARVYGYHNLPNNIQPSAYVKQPKDIDMLFEIQKKIKYFFKYRGFNEVMNYSMVSADTIRKLDGNLEQMLALSNTISEEIKFMRTSLLPSLIKNVADNQGKKETLNFFELAKVYLPKKDDLPDEKFRLGIITTFNFYELKGTIELLLKQFNINYSFKKSNHSLLSDGVQAEIFIDEHAGAVGKLKSMYKDRFNIKEDVHVAEIEIAPIITHAKQLPMYQSPSQYAVVKLDLTIPMTDKTYEQMKILAFEKSPLLHDMEVTDVYKNNVTMRFYFSNIAKNISEEEAKKELQTIKDTLGIKNG